MNKNVDKHRSGKTALPATGKRKYLTPGGNAMHAGDVASGSDTDAKMQQKPSASRRYLDSSEIDGSGSGKGRIAETQHISTKGLRQGNQSGADGTGDNDPAEDIRIKVSSRVTLQSPAVTEEAVVAAEGPSQPGGLSQRFLENLRGSIPVEATELDSDGILEIRSAGKEGKYELLELFAKGAESLLYRARVGRHIFCVKSIRNQWDGWLGNSKTRRDEEKLQDVSYSTKVRHLHNEHDVARALYSDQEDIPIVRVFGLRRVTRFGLELGYDLLMEYLWGHDLSQRNLLKMLTPEDKIRIMYEATQALNYMHKRKFIHLDIKPSNFVLTHTGRVRLIDFGISVLCGYRSRSITGTAGYLSPEQIAKETLDEKTDIFALGVTFAILFGGRPLQQTHSELLTRTTRRDAKFNLDNGNLSAVSEIPELVNMPQIAEIIRNCSILRRDDRISSCNYLLTLLQSAAEKYDIKLS